MSSKKGAVDWMLITIIAIVIAVAAFIIIFAVSGDLAGKLFGGLGNIFK